MITISINGSSIEDIRNDVAALFGGATLTIGAPTPIVVPKTEAAPQASAPAATGAISYQQVVDKGQALVKAKGKPALVAVLSTFNVKGGKELKEEQYAAFMQKADAALAS